jgi:hypothetical protein
MAIIVVSSPTSSGPNAAPSTRSASRRNVSYAALRRRFDHLSGRLMFVDCGTSGSQRNVGMIRLIATGALDFTPDHVTRGPCRAAPAKPAAQGTDRGPSRRGL